MSKIEASQLAELHEKLSSLEQEIAALRRQRSQREVPDHSFTAWDGQQVRLSELFGEKDQLILIHNMGFACSYCTMWADGFNGLLPHIEERAAFVVASPDDVKAQERGANERGWNFRMVSDKGSPFAQDMGFASEDGQPTPGLSIFVTTGDAGIRRHDSAPFGPGDKFCPVWSFFDLLPYRTGSDVAQRARR